MDITDDIKKALLASIGAAALTVEKSSEIVDTLVKKGEITVEQGKALNQELKHKVEEEKAEGSKPDVKSFVDSLSDEDLAKLKEALAAKEEKKTE
jgi:polyhydroxyalkanoate synthesis regulator phasin